MNMKDVANRNDGNYKESNEEWSQGDTNNGMGKGCPDGTHPSDYTKVGSKLDMKKPKNNG